MPDMRWEGVSAPPVTGEVKAMSFMDDFDVVMEQDGTRLWLRLEGDLDAGAAPDFRHAVTLAERSDASEVIIDLRDLEFLDSAGLGVLLQACSGPDGGRFGIVRGRPPVQRAIELSGLERELRFVPAAGAQR